MKRLVPLYDATAPIACTITPGEIPARIELVERIRQHMTSLERTEHGLLLHFPRCADIEADLHRFATDEKRCCEFWGFEIHADPALAFRWDAPPDAQDLMDRLQSFFDGNESLTDLAGLL